MAHKMNRIEWQNCFIHDFIGSEPVIEIKDDCETYCATMPYGSTPFEAVQDFARTYDFNGETDSIACSWHTYRDAGDAWEQENGGSFRLESCANPSSEAHGFAEMCL